MPESSPASDVAPELWDRALGAYLGFAIGDALGATVEFMRPREILLQHGTHRDIVGGGWLGWVVAVQDIATVESRLGRTAIDGHRTRPDGFDLQWKQVGVNDVIDNPQLPFFIEWVSSAEEHPSRGANAISIKSIEFSGDAQTITDYLGAPNNLPLDNIDIVWVKAETPGIVAVTFETAHGLVRID